MTDEKMAYIKVAQLAHKIRARAANKKKSAMRRQTEVIAAGGKITACTQIIDFCSVQMARMDLTEKLAALDAKIEKDFTA